MSVDEVDEGGDNEISSLAWSKSTDMLCFFM